MSSDEPRRTVRDELHGGGTSVGDGGFPWLLVGVGGAAALAAVVWWFAAEDTNGHRRPPEAPPAEPAPTPVPAIVTAPVAPPPAPVDTEAPRAAALAALERALTTDQLWATVERDGDAVVIRSAFCEDAGLTTHLASATAELRGAGFRTVRCVEQHGSVTFERPL